MSLDLPSLASIVERALDSAREQTLPRFRSVETEWKSDGSPVTEADREAERVIREVLREATPDFGIVGEEFENEDEGASCRWIIDPIDGTIAYSRGLPFYTSLIGLEVEGEPVLGAIDVPCLDERILGWSGGGAHRNGAPIRCSQESDLHKAVVSHGDRMCFEWEGELAWWERLAQLPMIRGYTDAFGHAQVFSGGVGVMVDLHLNLWDVAPIRAIAPEAGAKLVEIPHRPGKVGVVVGAPALVDAVLALREG